MTAPPHLSDLAAERMVVTGGSQGIGEGIARVAARCGAEVIIGYEPTRPCARLADGVVRTITTEGGTVTAVPLDLAEPSSIRRFVTTVWRHAPVTVLVNNAFWWNGRRFEKQTFKDLHRFALVDFVGTAYLTQQMLTRMRTEKVHGSVINITSVHQETIRRLHPPYSALKAALAMLTKELAVEYGPYGIRVNSVAPGHTETDPVKVRLGQRARNRFIPLQERSALPEDIGQAVAFLADHSRSGRITGTTIFVDGGERLFGEWAAKIPPGVDE